MDFPLARGGYIPVKERFRNYPGAGRGKGSRRKQLQRAMLRALIDFPLWPAKALLVSQPPPRKSQDCQKGQRRSGWKEVAQTPFESWTYRNTG